MLASSVTDSEGQRVVVGGVLITTPRGVVITTSIVFDKVFAEPEQLMP